jgi:NADH-quinone oxidoreductase subunit E
MALPPPRGPIEERPLTPSAPRSTHARGTRSTRAGEDPGAPVAAIPLTPSGAPVPVPTGPVVPPPPAPPKAAGTATVAPPKPAAPPKAAAPAAPPVARQTPPAQDRPAATRSSKLVAPPSAGRTVPKPVAPPARPPTPVAFPPEELRARCEALIARYPSRVAALIPILHLAQRHNAGWISPELEAGVAQYLGVSDQHVRGVVTFYTMFHAKPVGRHHVEVCRTLSCWLRGAEALTAELRTRTGCSPGETDPTGTWSVAEVECLGLCEVAPAVFVDGQEHGNVTPASLGKLLEGLS